MKSYTVKSTIDQKSGFTINNETCYIYVPYI